MQAKLLTSMTSQRLEMPFIIQIKNFRFSLCLRLDRIYACGLQVLQCSYPIEK